MVQPQVRSSSCFGVTAEPSSSWGAVRAMGSGKVSRMHFFLFIGKYKPVGGVCDSERLAPLLTLKKYKEMLVCSFLCQNLLVGLNELAY